MKISKLFHWLYAVLMLLPVAFIGVRCGYVMFNKNAKDSYYGDTINNYEVKDIYYDDIQYNVDYIITTKQLNNDTDMDISRSYLYFEILLTKEIPNVTNLQVGERYILGFYKTSTSENVTYVFSAGISTTQLYSHSTASNQIEYYDVKILSKYNAYNIDFFGNDIITENIYNEYSYLDNAFEYSVNQLNEVPLFSWAKDSFLIAPFSYITGLFGLASTSPINTLLSYWVSISIIWLVFDLVMYLPLLVHRWLDKGVLE